MKLFNVILTQDDSNPIPRKGCVVVQNSHVYLEPLNTNSKIFKCAYDARYMIDDSKDKFVCNGEGNYAIEKDYNCEDLDDTYLLDRFWLCLIQVNGDNDIISIVKNLKLS